MPKKFDLCMLIDDDPLDNFINKKLIKKNNFAEKVIVCDDAQKALKFLSSGMVPDIIFLDIKMPLMNGFLFLDEYDKLNINKDHTSIYILSMSLNPSEIEQAKLNKHVTSFLKKNLTPEMLLELSS